MVWIRMVPTCSCVSKFGLQTVWERVGGMALFKGVCHWVWVLGFEKPGHSAWFSLCLVLVDQVWALSYSPVATPACCMLPTMMVMDFMTLWKCKPSTKCSALVIVTLHSRRGVTKAIKTCYLCRNGWFYKYYLRRQFYALGIYVMPCTW